MFNKIKSSFSNIQQGKKLFNRNKHINNRQFANQQKLENIFVKQSSDILADNLSSIRKDYSGNIAYFGQGALDFLKIAPNNLAPKCLFICDIHEDFINHTLTLLKSDKELSQKIIVKNFNEENTKNDKIQIVPVCCDEEMWPFSDNSLQLIISNMNLHWVNDLQVVLIKWLESLEPDGTLIGSMFGADTLQELRIAYTLAENERYGGVSQHISPFITITEIGNLLSRFNYTLPTICTERNQYEFDSVYSLMQYLQDIGEGEALLQTREGAFKETIQGVSAIYQTLFLNENLKVNSTFEQIYFSAWKFHESQKKPKARGSAEISLQQLKKELSEMDPDQKMDYGSINEEGDTNKDGFDNNGDPKK